MTGSGLTHTYTTPLTSVVDIGGTSATVE